MTADNESPRSHDISLVYQAVVRLQETIEANTRALDEMRGVIIGTADAPGVLERVRRLEGHIAKFDPLEFAALKRWQATANWVLGISGGAIIVAVVTALWQLVKSVP